MDHSELTLAELLADPMTLAVMAADRVDPAELKAMLSALARQRVGSTRSLLATSRRSGVELRCSRSWPRRAVRGTWFGCQFRERRFGADCVEEVARPESGLNRLHEPSDCVHRCGNFARERPCMAASRQSALERTAGQSRRRGGSTV